MPLRDTADKNNFYKNRIKVLSIQKVLSYRPFALLIRGTEHAEGFILFLFAERAKRNKPKPFGQITLYSIKWDIQTGEAASNYRFS